MVLEILKQIAKDSVVDRAVSPPKAGDFVAKKTTVVLTIHQLINQFNFFIYYFILTLACVFL